MQASVEVTTKLGRVSSFHIPEGIGGGKVVATVHWAVQGGEGSVVRYSVSPAFDSSQVWGSGVVQEIDAPSASGGSEFSAIVIVPSEYATRAGNAPMVITAWVELNGAVVVSSTDTFYLVDKGKLENQVVIGNSFDADWSVDTLNKTIGVNYLYRVQNTATGQWTDWTSVGSTAPGEDSTSFHLHLDGLQGGTQYRIAVRMIGTDGKQWDEESSMFPYSWYFETEAQSGNGLFASKDTDDKAVKPTRWFVKKNGEFFELEQVYLPDSGEAVKFFG